MSVYMMIELNVLDPTAYGQYVDAVRPIVEAHGGRYLVRGGAVTSLAGGWLPERVVLIEFPSMACLRACFASEPYRALAPLREQSTTSRAIAIEGEA
jgi:uncharacterized protein (DUF1330 family)